MLVKGCFVGVAHPDVQLVSALFFCDTGAGLADPEPLYIFCEGQSGVFFEDPAEVGGVVVAQFGKLRF